MASCKRICMSCNNHVEVAKMKDSNTSRHTNDYYTLRAEKKSNPVRSCHGRLLQIITSSTAINNVESLVDDRAHKTDRFIYSAVVPRVFSLHT